MRFAREWIVAFVGAASLSERTVLRKKWRERADGWSVCAFLQSRGVPLSSSSSSFSQLRRVAAGWRSLATATRSPHSSVVGWWSLSLARLQAALSQEPLSASPPSYSIRHFVGDLTSRCLFWLIFCGIHRMTMLCFICHQLSRLPALLCGFLPPPFFEVAESACRTDVVWRKSRSLSRRMRFTRRQKKKNEGE